MSFNGVKLLIRKFHMKSIDDNVYADYDVRFQADRNKMCIFSQGGNEIMWVYYRFLM